MRLVAGLLAVVLAAPVAFADDAAPAPKPAPVRADPHARIPLRVVRVMPESSQALLFDRRRNTHVLVELGGTIDGYTVQDIGDDEVTLSDGGKEVVLAAPMRNRDRTAPRAPRIAHADAPAAPEDPYGEPAPISAGDGGVRVAAAPKDPYADDGDASAPRVVEAPAPAAAPRVVEAPAPAGEPPAPRTVEAPAAPAPRAVEAPAPPAPRAVDAPAAPAPRAVDTKRPPAPASKADAKHAHDVAEAAAIADLFSDGNAGAKATAAPVTPAARPGQVSLSRTEVDAALADFGKLAQAIHGSFTASGARLDGVADGSVFQRIGLRAGDTIASVNGIVPRSLDDAANIYALASTVKTMAILVVRDGKQSALRVAIQ